MGEASADGPGVGLDRLEAQAAAGEDLFVGFDELPVPLLGARVVGVKGVGVLHQEFPGPHDPEPGADLVAEFEADLVQGHGKLAPTAHLAPDQVGDDLLGGRGKAELRFLSVLDAQELLAVNLPTPGLLPQGLGLDHRQGHLQRPGAVHLRPDDPLHLAQDPQAEREPFIDPGRHLADHARPHHQARGHVVGVRRRFPEGGEKVTAELHGAAAALPGLASGAFMSPISAAAFLRADRSPRIREKSL